jgi:hypothetical protein
MVCTNAYVSTDGDHVSSNPGAQDLFMVMTLIRQVLSALSVGTTKLCASLSSNFTGTFVKAEHGTAKSTRRSSIMLQLQQQGAVAEAASLHANYSSNSSRCQG